MSADGRPVWMRGALEPGADGSFRIALSLSPGTYTFEASGPGAGATAELTIRERNNAPLVVQLRDTNAR